MATRKNYVQNNHVLNTATTARANHRTAAATLETAATCNNRKRRRLQRWLQDNEEYNKKADDKVAVDGVGRASGSEQSSNGWGFDGGGAGGCRCCSRRRALVARWIAVAMVTAGNEWDGETVALRGGGCKVMAGGATWVAGARDEESTVEAWWFRGATLRQREASSYNKSKVDCVDSSAFGHNICGACFYLPRSYASILFKTRKEYAGYSCSKRSSS